MLKFYGLFLTLIIFSAALRAQQTPSAQPADSVQQSKLPSDYLNRLLPAWLRFSGEYRSRFEGLNGVAFRSTSEDAYLLGRLRLNAAVAPVSWLRFRFQVHDSRIHRRIA